MATNLEDVTAVLTGLFGQAPTPAELQLVIDAAMDQTTDKDIEAAFPGVARAALTVNQKCKFARREMRQNLRQFTNSYNARTIRKAARDQIEASNTGNTI